MTPVNDAIELEKALREILDHPEYAEKIAFNAHKITETYSPEGTIDSWRNFLAQFEMPNVDLKKIKNKRRC